jgi:hypothetical protein
MTVAPEALPHGPPLPSWPPVLNSPPVQHKCNNNRRLFLEHRCATKVSDKQWPKWCGVTNNFGMSVYLKCYTFPIFLGQFMIELSSWEGGGHWEKTVGQLWIGLGMKVRPIPSRGGWIGAVELSSQDRWSQVVSTAGISGPAAFHWLSAEANCSSVRFIWWAEVGVGVLVAWALITRPRTWFQPERSPLFRKEPRWSHIGCSNMREDGIHSDAFPLHSNCISCLDFFPFLATMAVSVRFHPQLQHSSSPLGLHISLMSGRPRTTCIYVYSRSYTRCAWRAGSVCITEAL